VPLGRGPFPAVVWVHGAGESTRIPYDGAPLVRALVDSGIAVLSYDKRGVGESEGECCPGDYGQFNLLAADVDGAVAALRSRPEIDPSRIGLLGASQAGWVVPLAAVRSGGRVAFTALVDAPAVSTGEEDLYSQETGEQGSPLRLASFVRTAGGLRTPGPAGFDPHPYLEQLETPGLWLYGGADRSQPTDEDVDVLNRLKENGKDFRVLVYPEADHGLLDVPPTDPRALPEVVRWIKAQTDPMTAILDDASPPLPASRPTSAMRCVLVAFAPDQQSRQRPPRRTIRLVVAAGIVRPGARVGGAGPRARAGAVVGSATAARTGGAARAAVVVRPRMVVGARAAARP
jgi:pimeloyl-ACP methyl ester carboxylesterase